MPKATCTLYHDGKTVDEASVRTDNRPAAINGAQMKVLSSIDWDEMDRVSLECK